MCNQVGDVHKRCFLDPRELRKAGLAKERTPDLLRGRLRSLEGLRRTGEIEGSEFVTVARSTEFAVVALGAERKGEQNGIPRFNLCDL